MGALYPPRFPAILGDLSQGLRPPPAPENRRSHQWRGLHSFNEALFIKEPGVGAAVSWHQDGTTHWESDDFDQDIHGFNFMAQVYGSTAVNGVWVLPGSHKLGKVDIKQLVKESGSERIDGTVPLICNPGDVVICNRQIVHGSFPNSGFEPRITVNMGFHRRSSVLNVMGAGTHNEAQVFDEALIAKRSEVIGYGIDARRQRFPDETPYTYQPFAKAGWRINGTKTPRHRCMTTTPGI